MPDIRQVLMADPGPRLNYTLVQPVSQLSILECGLGSVEGTEAAVRRLRLLLVVYWVPEAGVWGP